MHIGKILALALGALVPAAAGGGDWPQFRGPGGNGLSAEPIPAEWGPDKNVAWKVEVPGAAWSCPIVSGDKVFVTTAITDNQRKPSGGFGGGFGGPPGGGRPGGPPGGPPGGGRPGGPPGGFGRGMQPPNAVYRWRVLCLDRATGKVLWDQLALEAKPRIPTHASNTFASETPVTDG